MDKVVHVDPGSTSLQLVGDTDGSLVVLGVDTGCEPVAGVVGELNDLVLVLERCDGDDGSEDLLSHDLHVWLDVREDGRLDEVSLSSFLLRGFATECDSGALRLAGLDIPKNLVILHLGVLWALVDIGIEVVTDLDLLQSVDVSLDEIIVYRFVNVDSSTGVAGLAEVHVDTPDRPLNSLLDVRIGEDNVLGMC